MKPLVDPAFWSDPDIESALPRVKLCALWLITNSQTSLIGVCQTSLARFKFETGLEEKALQTTLEALPRAFVKIGSAIFLRNYIRHQFGTGEKLKRNNFFVALRSLFLSIKDHELKAEVLKEYPEFEDADKGLPRAYEAQGKDRTGKSREGKGSAEGKWPTRDEMADYATEIGMALADFDAWFDHFESNGWKVSGKTVMKDWKAAMRNGNRRKDEFSRTNGTPASEASKYKIVATS